MPKNAKTTDIFELKLRHVHKAILSAKNVSEVVNKLNVTWSSFNKYLNQFIDADTGQATTFDDLKNKWVNEQAGKKHWGDLYDKLVAKPVNNSKELQFHSIFKLLADPKADIKSRYALSLKLQVPQGHIDKYLARFSLVTEGKSAPLNFDTLKENVHNVSLFQDALGAHYDEIVAERNAVSEKKAQKTKKKVTAWSANNQSLNNNHNPFQSKNYNEENLTIKIIHEAILESDSIQIAEKKLKFATNTLNRFLEQFYITDNRLKIPLTFATVKHYLPTPQAAIRHFQYHYNRPMRPFIISFDERPLYDVHQIILFSDCLAEAAVRFNLSIEELEVELNHLGFYSHKGSSSFDKIKQISKNDGLRIWGLNYYFPIKSMANGFQLTPRIIHQAILASSDIDTAENKLKIPQGTLEPFLNQYYLFESKIHVHIPLSFEKIKRFLPTAEQAQRYFGKDYDKIMIPTPVPFNRRTFHEVHRAIVKSNNLAEAAAELNVPEAEMEEQLNLIGYGYTAIKELWPDILSGMDAWKSAYNSTIVQLQNNPVGAQSLHSTEQLKPQTPVIADILATHPELTRAHGLFKRKRSQESDSDERELKRRKTDESERSIEESASDKESSSSDDNPSSSKLNSSQ